MRNQRVVLIAALLLLLIGGGLAGYFIVVNENESGRRDEQRSALNGASETDSTGGSSPGAVDTPDRNSRPNSMDGAKPEGTGSLPGGADAAKTAESSKPVETAGPKTDVPKTAEVVEDLTKNWPTKTSEFVVTGKITYKADGRPAAGAAISAEKSDFDFMTPGDGPAPAVPMGADKIEGSTTSDGAGEFTLRLSVTRKVPPGAEDTSDAAKGARTMFESAVYVQVVGKMAGYAPARSGQVALHEGKEAKALLSLSVPAAVTGRVIDAATRAGIEGAQVEIYSADFDAGAGWTPPRHVKTAKDGFFSVTDLPAGSYMFGASAEGYSDVSAWQGGKRADLGRGGEQDIGEIALLKAGTLTGTVVDLAGQPIKGAQVEISSNTQFGNFMSQSGSTDEAGRFEIKNAGSGVMSLTAKADGYAPTTIDKITIESGTTTDAGTIKLGRGFSLEGRVVDGAGAGISGANVSLKENKPGFVGWGPGGESLGSAVSGPDGAFKISGLVEGSARVEVTAAGFARLESEVELKPGMAALTLKLGKGVNVTGRVLTSAGGAAGNVAVGLINHAGQYYSQYKLLPAQFQSTQYFGDGAPQARTGDDGRFSIGNVPSGTYLLLAVPTGGKGAARNDIKIAEGQDVDVGELQLPGPGTALIRVTEGSQPVTGLKVELRPASWAWTVGGSQQHPNMLTDSTGAAEFRDVAAGEYLVMTERDKTGMDTEVFGKRRIEVRTGQVTEFKLELKPANSVRLHGRVTMDGKPGFRKMLLLGTGARESFFKETKPDESGYYEFEAVSLGTYVLHATVVEKQMTCPVPLNLDKAGDVEVTRDFSVRTVSGAVTTPNNTASERASVRVTLQRTGDGTPETFAQWLRAELKCDAEGKFRFEYISNGSYRLSASLEGVGAVGRDVVVSGSDVSGADMALVANGGTLRVIVKKLHGSLPSTQSFGFVQVKDSAGHLLDFDNDGTGFFLPANNAQVDMPTIPAGTYTVIINAGGCLPQEKTGVVITKDQRTDLEIELRVAAELSMTVTNSEVTQAMLDAARVTYLDAQGAEVTKPTSPFDSWNAPAVPEKPTLRARYIGPTVTQVKIKVQGFAEVVYSIEFEAGKRIEKNETLLVEP